MVQSSRATEQLHSPVLVDDVADDERGEQEQAGTGHSALRLDVDLMDGDQLPLRCGGFPHHLHFDEQPQLLNFFILTYLRVPGWDVV